MENLDNDDLPKQCNSTNVKNVSPISINSSNQYISSSTNINKNSNIYTISPTTAQISNSTMCVFSNNTNLYTTEDIIHFKY